MVKIAFCDDDIAVVRQITALLNKYRETRDQPMECHAFESSLELLAAMEQGLRPDVLLLDVIMPGENGISAAREIREYDRNVKIIFLTSSAEYAVQSYTVDAYYYQLKPIREETFFQVLDSVLDECCRSAENSVMLRCKSGIVRVRLEKLMYCEVVGRTLLLHLDNGQVLESAGGLDKLAAELTAYENFVRPHRSYLVNMNHIQSISYRGLQLTDQMEIPIPHGRFSELKERYLEYAFSRKQVLL
jgi:DNA-binding LytR/AlgR family response regulator